MDGGAGGAGIWCADGVALVERAGVRSRHLSARSRAASARDTGGAAGLRAAAGAMVGRVAAARIGDDDVRRLRFGPRSNRRRRAGGDVRCGPRSRQRRIIVCRSPGRHGAGRGSGVFHGAIARPGRSRRSGRRARSRVRSHRRQPATRSRGAARWPRSGSGVGPVPSRDGGRVWLAAADAAGRRSLAARRRSRTHGARGRDAFPSRAVSRSRRRACPPARWQAWRWATRWCSTACVRRWSPPMARGSAGFASAVMPPPSRSTAGGKILIDGEFSPMSRRGEENERFCFEHGRDDRAGRGVDRGRRGARTHQPARRRVAGPGARRCARDGDGTDGVSLRVGGEVWAEGEIVDIDGELGVRVTRLANR